MSRPRFVSSLLRFIAIAVAFFATAGTAVAGSITLAWDPSPSGDAAGYLVVYGTAAGLYTNTLNVGNQTTVTLHGLAGGQVYYFAIEAYSASGGLSVLSNEVSGTTTNTAPQLTSPGTQINDEGSTVSLSIAASDGEGDPLTFIATGLPLGLLINPSTGLISGTLEYTEAGSHAVTITVTDGVAFTSVAFTWNVQAVDRLPIVIGPANQSSPVGGVVSLQVIATDADGDTLTYDAAGLPPELSMNTATGLISGTLTSAGSYNVTVTASDGTLTSNASFTWTVVASNGPPTLAPVSNQESSIVNPVSLQLSANDPDGNTLSFSSANLPPGVTLNALTGLITGTPTTVGTYGVTVGVSDGLATASRSFNWVIDPNRSPLITNPGNQSSVEGQFVSLQIVASDPDGRPLVYTSSLPNGLSISDHGLVTGMVPSGSSGLYSASVTVSDGVNETSVSFQWSIALPSPTPPVFVTQATFAIDRNVVGPNRADLSINVTGTNSMLIVALHSEFDGGDTNWTVQDNGVQGTLLAGLPGYAGGAGNARFRVYYWLNPPQGANAIVVQNSYTSSNELSAAAILLNNVAQANALGALATDLSAVGRTSETETVATTTSDLVIHIIADALMIRGNLGPGETSVAVANDGLQKSSAGDGDASLWIATKPGGASSTTVSSSGWASSPAPAPRPLNAVAFTVHGASFVPVPDLTVASAHQGAFSRGQAGAVYNLTVTNAGTAPTVGVVTISDVLPAGLTATGMSGPGWTCSVAALSCQRSDPLAPGTSYPAVLLTTTVATDAATTVTNAVSVSGNEVNTANDTATDPTLITIPGVAATPAFVQVNFATPQSSQSLVTVTYAAAQTAGNLNVVVVGWNDPARRVQSVTDAKGNAYVLAIGPTLQSGLGGQSIYYSSNIVAAAAGTNTVTVTFDGLTAFPDIRIAEYSGIDGNPVDVTIAGQGTGTTANSGAVTTTSSTDLLVAADLVTTSTTAAGGGFTSRVITTPDGDILMDRVVTATGNYSASATLSANPTWIMQLVAFRALGSTGGQTPIITSRSPSSGPVGTTVTLGGVRFGATQGTSTVTFNGTPAAVSNWSDTGIAATVPGGATSGNIVVTVGGVASNGMSFVVLPTPTLVSRAPASGPAGTIVSITGTNFGASQGTSTVTFNGTVTAPTAWSDTNLSVPVPSGATTGYIVVTVGGVASNGLLFTIRHTPTLAPIANQTNVENDPVNLAVSASDLDGDPLTYSATGLPAGLSISPSSGAITGTLSYTSSGPHNVIVTVSDGTLSASQSFAWTVTNVNRTPTLAAIASQTNLEHDTISLAVSGADPDGDPLTYSATGLPTDLTISPSTGTIGGVLSYSSAGTYTVTVTVSDGTLSASQVFGWTITDVNRAPGLAGISDQTNGETDTVQLSIIAGDPDGDVLSFSATGLPPGLGIDTATGTMTGTLTHASHGTHLVSVTASDGHLSATRSFTWTVTDLAPVIAAIGNLTTVTGAPVSIQASASDPDSDPITYSATGLPNGVSIAAATGLLTGAPTAAGVYNVSVLVSDGATQQSASFVWTVSSDPPGRVTFIQAHSSSVVSSVASVSAVYPAAQVQGSLNVVVVGWKDPAAQVLSVSDASGNAYQLGVGPTTRTEVGNQSIYYAPNVAAAAAGVNVVTVTFTSPVIKAEVRAVEYQGVEPANVVDVTAGTQGNSGQADSGPVTTTFRNDLLFGAVWSSWATTTPQDGLKARLTTASGMLLEDATVSTLGTYNVRAAIDPPSPWIIQMVAFRDVNHAPSINSIADQTTAEGTVVSLQVVATDSDADVLTYSATGLPQGLSISPATGLISGTLTYGSSGVCLVTISVFDGLVTTNQPFTWTVTDVNGPPVLAVIPDQVGAEGNGVSLTVSATDPDGDAITYSATGLPPGLTINASTGVIFGLLSITTSPTYAVTVTASAGSLSASRSFTWTVDRSPRFPWGGAFGNISRTTTTGDFAVIPITAVDPDGDAITYSATGLPPGTTIDPGTGTISGAPSAAGSYVATVLASDPVTHSTINLTWTVRDAPTTSIRLVQAASTMFSSGTTTSVSYAAPQRVGDLNVFAIAWSASVGSPGLSSLGDSAGSFYQLAAPIVTGTRSLAVFYANNINAASAGTNTVTVTFTGPVDFADLTIAEYAGMGPVNIVDTTLVGTGTSASISPGPIVMPYGHDLLLAAVAGPLATNGAGFDFAVRSGNSMIEQRVLTSIGVINQSIASISTVPGFTWALAVVAFRYNHAPVLVNPGNQLGTVGASVSRALSASDSDGDSLTYSATGLPQGLVLNATSGLITGTPSAASVGFHTVNVTVADANASSTQRFLWGVQLPNGVTPLRRQDDFDGDRRSDLTTYRPSNGTWYVLKSTGNFTSAQVWIPWGNNTDVPAPGDYDGDGKTDPAVFRPSTGQWQVAYSSTNYVSGLFVTFGVGGDVPVPGDYDGDGLADIAIFRPTTGEWRIRRSSDGATQVVVLGITTDIPVPGDYDGDGKVDPAIYRPAIGKWQVLLSSSGYATTRVVHLGGGRTDLPVPADYDGDGITDFAVFQRSTAQWLIVGSISGTMTTTTWGTGTDRPVPADYDGDGKADLAVFRPSTQQWLIQRSSDGTSLTVKWGASGDLLPTDMVVDNGIRIESRPQVSEITRAGDFDGDGRSDLTTYRPSNGTWFVLKSTGNFGTSQVSFPWGTSTDLPVPGDYDGDGKTDPAFFRPSTGEWQILYSSTNYTGSVTIPWGVAGDLPVPGDYDGDGKTDIAVYHPTTGWQVRLSSTGATMNIAWGWPNDVPVPGDYDGDGKADAAVYRPLTNEWRILLSSTGNTASQIVSVGSAGDLPVPSDFDGDGKTDVAMYHKTGGLWQIVLSSTGATTTIPFGGAAVDVPLPGDYDGDGKADLAVYRNGTWFVLESHANYTTQWNKAWGATTDRPGPSVTLINYAAVQARKVLVDARRATDVDGDGRSDLITYRPSNGTWFVLKSTGNFGTAQVWFPWGTSTDIPAPGDYDGDGKMDPAFFRPSTGQWQILLSSSGYVSSRVVAIGGSKDLPVPGDYDGDGKTDVAVYHPATGQWQIVQSSTNTTVTATWGLWTDIPVPGDYDGDGRTDLAVYRPSLGQWRILNSGTGTPSVTTWGTASDFPVPADYDGDGRVDVAFYRVSTGEWQIMQSATNTTRIVKFGGSAVDLPVPGDYDGDGKADLATYRNGQWFVLESHSNYTTQWNLAWGASTDRAGPSVVVANALVVRAKPRATDMTRASDFDGDGIADVTTYEPGTGTWASLSSLTNFTTTITHVWGTSTDVPVPGDYDGDGKTDPAYFRPSTGEWQVLLSGSNYIASLTVPAGVSTDLPVPGDYDGDGKTDVALYRPGTGEWRILTSSSNFTTLLTSPTFGSATDRPVPGDYDGDGKTDLAYFRPATGQWFVLFSAANYTTSMTVPYGITTDALVPGDYDGDGKTDIAIYRKGDGKWWMLFAKNNFTSQTFRQWGTSTDRVVVADFDGDGKADHARYDSVTGSWNVLLSGGNYTTTLSRVTGTSDLPMPPHP